MNRAAELLASTRVGWSAWLGGMALLFLWLVLAQGALDFVRGRQTIQGHAHVAVALRVIACQRRLMRVLRRLRERGASRSLCRCVWWLNCCLNFFHFGVHKIFEDAVRVMPPNS